MNGLSFCDLMAAAVILAGPLWSISITLGRIAHAMEQRK